MEVISRKVSAAARLDYLWRYLT
jgi:hypothetical protein